MNPYKSGKEAEPRGTVRMQAPLGERQIVTELTEEVELPDYQPEIKRLLRVQAKVMPPEEEKEQKESRKNDAKQKNPAKKKNRSGAAR